jgi:8-amino-3,8-dideoxy-alpha-D-manno-octulosonate transaminase
MKVARKHRLKVVEDCAQSCGGRFNGRYVGTIGDLGCFSISAYKTVGAGEGGLVLTNNQKLWDRANTIVEGGGLWRPNRFAPPRYKGELFCGTNYRMSELEAAVDVVQLKKMETTVQRFRTVKKRVLTRLRTYREILPQKLNDADGEVGYTLRFFPDTIALGEKLVAALRAEGISCGMRGTNAGPDWHIYSYMYPLLGSATDVKCPFECPVYLERGGRAKYAKGDCPIADDLYARMISVGLNQWLTPGDCRNIADGMNKVLSAYCTEDKNATPWRG